MKCSLSLFLAAAAVIAAAAARGNGPAQEMQQGVSVQMADTNSATSMPEADTFGAWIVTVTDSGKLYFGVHVVTADRLIDEMKSRPRDREQKFYIKADARTPYANVKKVYDAGREVGFETQVLLTSQPSPPSHGTVVPPKGLEVWSSVPAESTTIRLQRSSGRWPRVKINRQMIPWTSLQDTTHEFLMNRSNAAVGIEADGQLPFGDVVRVIDVCRADGAKVALLAAEF
ncbi:MAG TPA: biopolymer transporter ExbD [Candidatus Acidoferrum sp.]|jgi:biopolymer transport protein ExbD|nr:biopolymer transporter ExbD [Candidatus Acidoferrum sp.]